MEELAFFIIILAGLAVIALLGLVSYLIFTQIHAASNPSEQDIEEIRKINEDIMLQTLKERDQTRLPSEIDKMGI